MQFFTHTKAALNQHFKGRGMATNSAIFCYENKEPQAPNEKQIKKRPWKQISYRRRLFYPGRPGP